MSKRFYLDLDDAITAPLEILGWQLDALVKARVQAELEVTTSESNRHLGSSSLGAMHSYEIDSLEIGPIQVVSPEGSWMQLNQETIPVSIRRAFEQAVERAVIAQAKLIPDFKWEAESEDF